MTQRLVDIDDDVLELARAALGTRTLEATVHAALAAVAAAAHRRRFVERMVAEGLPDLSDPAVVAAAWR